MMTFLLPLVLVMYGEMSNCKGTRFISRVLFASFMMSWYIPSTIIDPTTSISASMCILVIGFGICIANSDLWIGKVLLSFTLSGLIISHLSVLTNDYFLLQFEWISRNSAFILRESILIAVVSCTKLSFRGEWDQREMLLSYLTIMLYGLEWFLYR